jgi:amino acid adenylation domain-containing protein
VRFTLPLKLTEQLQQLARQENGTLFMVLLAAFQLVLSRWTRQEDIVVGTAVANRDNQAIENLIGFFVNTLVMRTDLSGNPSFRQLLGRVRETALGAYAHQDLPFEKLVEILRPTRDLSRNTLFQAMFVLQGRIDEPAPIGDLHLSVLTDKTQGTAKLDLILEAWETPTGLTARLEYATDLFDDATAERFAAHWSRLLEQAVAAPDAPIATLSMLSDQERGQLIRDWSQTERAFDQTSLPALLDAQAARTPDGVAVIFGETSLSYRQLAERSNQLARHLQTLGVGPDKVVGLCIDRSPDLIVAMLAILKAGGAFLSVDPAYPDDRRAYMVEDSQAALLLTEDWLAAESAAIAAQLDAPLDIAIDPEQLAYIIYTSGSTGRPKGAMIPHRGAANLYRWYQQTYDLKPGRSLLVVSSYAFDLTLKNLIAPLIAGATLVLAPPGLVDTPVLRGLLERHKVDLINCAPSQLYPLLEEPEPLPASLEWVILGGEPIRNDLLRPVGPANPRCRFVNSYGPTEVSDVVIDGEVTNPGAPGPVTILGRPIANIQATVLDAAMNPAPIGVPGELYLGGQGLGRGYHHRPGLTAERFVPNPFAEGQRLYRTGDLVRWRADGTLEFLGRIDHQVKIRGFRIEPGEIEAALRLHPAIREVVVVARDQRLVAYLVTSGPVDLAVLRSHLQDGLPDYMIPAVFHKLDRLPMTPSGKIDRKALPEPAQTITDSAYVGPRSDAEEMVAAIFAEFLGLERVHVQDNFFALGGHSLLAMRMANKIRRVFEIQLPVRTIFTDPTVEALAAVIEGEMERQISELAPDELERQLANQADA